jgi:hypothetical protein
VKIKGSVLYSKFLSILSISIVLLIAVIGTIRAFHRGGSDFAVFYTAWQHVLAGHGVDIYRVSTDRFLYAPGFAWVLSPLGILPKNFSLGLWCLLKSFALISIIVKMSQACRPSQSKLWSVGLSSFGVILLTRPLLIDFEYGQVNLFIVGASVWALLGHFEEKPSPFWDLLRWSFLSFVAAGKLFPLPLLLVPWVVKEGVPQKKLQYERIGSIAGVLPTILLPVMSVGWSSTIQLFIEWREALLARGLPLEAHNQSFTALLYHYLSGSPTHVHARGGPMLFGHPVLSSDQIALFSLSWALMALGFMVAWIITGSFRPRLQWMAVVVGLLIVPSHLVWKPYFVMSIPLAVLLVHQRVGYAIDGVQFKKKRVSVSIFGILALFVGVNLTSFDFIGHTWAAHFEAASVLLLMHMIMIGMVMSAPRHTLDRLN